MEGTARPTTTGNDSDTSCKSKSAEPWNNCSFIIIMVFCFVFHLFYRGGKDIGLTLDVVL